MRARTSGQALRGRPDPTPLCGADVGSTLGRFAAIAVIAASLASCTTAFQPRPLVATDPRRLPAFVDDGDVGSLRLVVERTVPVLERSGRIGAARAAERLVGAVAGTADPVERARMLTRSFRVMRVRDPVLVTSYYEPEIAVSETADARYRYPLYRRPPDLTNPYRSRAEIDAGALDGLGLELAWTDDAFELFSLHVQGSGRARFPDGHVAAIRFAGTNGLPYKSLGAVLVRRGLLQKDEASLFGIRRVLATLSHTEQRALMAENPRYVFFTMTDGSQGPIGSMGVELTPMRSVATDPDLVPAGTIGYVVTPTVRRFVVAQDTGGAIRGAHADLFAGSGVEAEQFAGRQKELGTMYVLVPM
jgi:membrane-bound lytic murein transglycosylase A